MKNKSIRLSLMMLILTSILTNVRAQTKFGIKGGVAFSNVSINDESGNKGNTQSVPGVVLGFTVDVPITGDFFIQPAAQYLRGGFKQKSGGFYGTANDFEVRASYLQLPINFIFKPHAGTGNLLLGTGPYLGYGTGGTWKSGSDAAVGDIVIGNKGNVIFRNNVSDGGDVNSYLYGKSFDFGANLLAGYEFRNQLSVQINVQFGLANLQPKFDGIESESSLKNHSYGISLGYKFK